MIKWTRLQLSKLPVVAIQADHVIQKLQQLTHKVNLYANNQDIQSLNDLRQSIHNRIQALDRFYEKNYLDSSISIFHMVKLKLKKAVFKIQHISNETMTLDMLSQIHKKDSQSMMASGSQWYKYEESTGKTQQVKKEEQFKVLSKPKSKSKNKKQRNNNKYTKNGYQNDYRDQQTDLMQQVNFIQSQKSKKKAEQENQFLFDENINTYEPLFKSNINQQKNTRNQTKKINNENIKMNKSKPKSPLNRNFHKNQSKLLSNNTPKYNDKKNTKNTTINATMNNSQQMGKIGQKYSTSNNSLNLNTSKVDINTKTYNKQKTIKMKTQGPQQTKPQTKSKQQNSQQFRFTIKMTRQQYKNLLQMKQLIKLGKLP